MKRHLLFALILPLLGCAHSVPTAKPQHYRSDTDFHPRAKTPTFAEGKGPRVCFDQGHNNLAVTQGNYEPILELLVSDGFHVVRKPEPFTQKLLKKCDILYTSAVLGHPNSGERELTKRSAFNDEEINAITKWVNEGGSLLVMTDHKPMSNAAAKLLKRFNVEGSINNIRDPEHPVPPFKDPGIFSIEGDRLNASSPIIKGRNPSETLHRIYFFYGEALRGTEKADVFLKPGTQSKIGGIYGDEETPVSRYPALALAQEVGKGRLVVFGDGTVFTSKLDIEIQEKTGINRDGSDNVQMALNVFHWLARIL